MQIRLKKGGRLIEAKLQGGRLVMDDGEILGKLVYNWILVHATVREMQDLDAAGYLFGADLCDICFPYKVIRNPNE